MSELEYRIKQEVVDEMAVQSYNGQVIRDFLEEVYMRFFYDVDLSDSNTILGPTADWNNDCDVAEYENW